jgi:non-specific serine/threonine protein kinase
MNTLADLLAAHRAAALSRADLLRQLAARGAVAAEQHAAELALLQHADNATEDEMTLSAAILACLQQTQQASTQTLADEDATVVKPASLIASMSAIPLSDVDHDATVVKPAATLVPTQGATANTTLGTGSSGGWRRIAAQENVEHSSVGMLLKERFLLERELGRGGMGVVYLARDERKVEARDRDPYVAVKVLNDEFRRHPDSLIALQREARRAQALAHDNIVRVYDFDKDGAIVFMTMEYIDGADLRSMIRKQAFSGMPLAEAWPLIVGMARALRRAHSADVVHSDFKPGNVMIDRHGVPKVFDFGIARAGKHPSEASGEQTVFDASTLGALTPAYASLEMLQGKQPSPSDDIYALGCVVFELLTGKHPFDKLSAEQAMQQGLRPPLVAGLSKRQYKALCDSVAFSAEKRLQHADALIEGLRQRGLRERAGPFVLYGGLLLAALGAAGWGTSQYVRQRHLGELTARFMLSDPRHFSDEDQAWRALGHLSEGERRRLVLDQSELIQTFFLQRIDVYWNPAKQRYDYVGLQHLFQVRDMIKLFSPKLDIKRAEVERQRNDLLNTLDTQLSERIAAGAIFPGQPDNAPAVLARIRMIDPHSGLLDNAELELKYDTAIGQSLEASDVAQARQQLSVAQALFPTSARLHQRATQLATLQAASAQAPAASATAGLPAAASSVAPMSVPAARAALSTLLAAPISDANWRSQVTAAMTPLHGDASAPTQALIDKLSGAIIAQVVADSDPTHAAQNLDQVRFGLQYAPADAPLLAQQDRLQALQQQAQAQLDEAAADAEVAARIESLRRAAAANDIAKAQKSLARIQVLQPANPVLQVEGPQLVADAYLGQARSSCQQRKWNGAIALVVQGIKRLGNRLDLRNAQARYQLVSDLMAARNQTLTSAEYQHLQQQLAQIRHDDPSGIAEVESDLRDNGTLPQGTLDAFMLALKARVSDVAASVAAPAVVPQGPDLCARRGMAGSGRICFDSFNASSHGPALVVIPGIENGKPYALSRADISVSDFNLYCNSTHQCAVTPVVSAAVGNTPVRDISLAQAQAYARWLTHFSGYVYRLPTDEEWLHAAHAGGQWVRGNDADCLRADDHSLFGLGRAPDLRRGQQPNPWGLVNLAGGVWQWVTQGTGVMVRGGSFNSDSSECTVDAHRNDTGAARRDVGFRLLREIK